MTQAAQIQAILDALVATCQAAGVPAGLFARTIGGFPAASIELPEVDWGDLEDSDVPLGMRRVTLSVPVVVYVQLTNAGDDSQLALSSAMAIVEAVNSDPDLSAANLGGTGQIQSSSVQSIRPFINQPDGGKPTAGYVATCQVIAFISFT